MEQENRIEKEISLKYWVIGLVLSGLIFIVDIQTPLGVADGMLYVILVLLGLMAKNRSFIVYAAILGFVLNVVGYLASPPGGEWSTVLANRFLAVFTIWMTAILCLIIYRAEKNLRSAHDKLEEKIKDAKEKFEENKKNQEKELVEGSEAELVKPVVVVIKVKNLDLV